MAYDAALDPADIGLKGIFGDRFIDATEAPQRPAEVKKEKVSVYTHESTKAAQKAAERPTTKLVEHLDASWEPTKPKPDTANKLIAATKWLGLFGGLCMLVWYWQLQGLMATSIAVPVMCVCNALGGWFVAKSVMQ